MEEERGSMKENHKVMTYKKRQFIRKRWLLPRLESTRVVEVFHMSQHRSDCGQMQLWIVSNSWS